MQDGRKNLYEFGSFSLDQVQGILLRNNEVVDLTPKALKILEVLIENHGQVVSKADLMTLVWPNSFVEEANLSHHIFKLRKALNEQGDRPIIETIPRRGYRFVGDLNPRIDQTPTHSSEPRRYSRVLVYLGAVLLIGGSIGYWYLRPGNNPLAPSQQGDVKNLTSIAVMPFVNESGDQEVEYLADGMTETLIASLSQVPQLGVKPRTAVFRYKGRDLSASAVADDLKVQRVLYGRITQRGDEVTLFLSLIDPATEYQVWGKRYGGHVKDMLSIQSSVAREVAAVLSERTGSAATAAVPREYTKSSDAYVLYLKGRYQLNRKTKDSFQKGISLFNEALALDPDYALAYAGIADAYNQMGVWITLPPSESFPRARWAADKALGLDPTMAEAHAAVGFEKFYYEWDFPGSRESFKRAIELNANNSSAHEYYAIVLYETDPRRIDDAMRELRSAQQIDPLSLSVAFSIASLQYFEGQHDQALAGLKSIQETDPNYSLGNGLLGAVYREIGRYDEYVDAWLRASSLEGGDLNRGEVQALSSVYHTRGLKAYEVAYAELLAGRPRSRYTSPIFVAMHYSVAGDKDKAFEWLERAFAERSSWLIELKVDPVWKDLHADPRYGQMLSRVGLVSE